MQELGNSNRTFYVMSESGLRSMLLVLPLFIILIIILRSAWTCDDAYISFRTIYNFTHGYGLTFNINERVQSFTDPLWILALSIPYFFTNEAYFTSIILGTLVSLAAYYILLKRVAQNQDIWNVCIVTLLIISSKALIDFSTSGLENPLSNLLCVVFFTYYFQDVSNGHTKFKILCLLAAFSAVNRLDTFLFFFPVLVFEYFKLRDIKAFRVGLIGFSPLILWELFSIIYYGFPFPNTYYTKLNTGLPSSFYMTQGINYYINSFGMDPITLSTIFLVLILIVISFNKNIKFILVGAGIFLYMVYVIKIGGDFMSGRFFTIAFCASLCLLAQIKLERPLQVIIVALAVLANLSNHFSPIYADSKYRKSDIAHLWEEVVMNNGVADERATYYQGSGLLLYSPHLFNAKIEKSVRSFSSENIHITGVREARVTLGYEGYETPPNTYVFHHMALSDPLLTRLPILNMPTINWRIGHYFRRFPTGYLASILTQKNQLLVPEEKTFYDKMNIITRDPVFSWGRFNEIINMNMGVYNNLIAPAKYTDLENAYHVIDFNSPLDNLAPDSSALYCRARSLMPSSIKESGFVLWGPFIPLPAGKYNVEFSLKIDSNQVKGPIAEVDVFSIAANGSLASRVISGTDFLVANKFQPFALDFDLPVDLTDIEFRVKYFRRGNLRIDFVKVKRR